MQDAFTSWLRSVQSRVDVVMVHEPALIAPALAVLRDDPPSHPLLFVTGHTHKAALDTQPGIAVVNGGSIGGGGTGNLAEDAPTDVGIARVVYTADPAFRPLAVDLVSIDPSTGSATARRGGSTSDKTLVMNQTATLAAPQPRVLADFLMNTRVRDAALVLTAALLTAACAQISIPIPGSPVPVTGQTFAVLLTGAALGANRGASGQLLYVAMGLVGLPFYADGAHGVDVVWGATGGYLIAFPISAWVCGRLAEKRYDRTPQTALPAFLAGSLIVFAIGVPWLAVSADISLWKAIDLGFVPFIPGGILKAALAAGLLPTAWAIANRK